MAGPTQIRLDEALTAVVDHVLAVCQAGRQAGGLLDGVTAVVSGDRARVRPDPPYLWVTIGAGEATHARALHEQWQAALLLSAFVRAEEPEEGWLEAVTLAARARSLVLRDRGMGLGFVEDTQSRELGPLGQFRPSRKFGAFARLDVRLAIVEPKE